MISTACSAPKARFDNPSHHLVALSPHNDTDSNSNSPILPPAIALSSPTCPKPSFVCGPKSSMPKVPVKDVIICLRWVIGPASAVHLLLLPPLLALPTHFHLPLLRLYLPPQPPIKLHIIARVILNP
ncbi:hypothetical protein B0H13DRAFT_2668775 [Mycena leptocephala]|nr:hypothetical protein B0H13DRAFT_2668775 [Mycena leptocephala]